MLKRNLCKRVAAAILSAALVMTSALTGMVAAPLGAEAASSYENVNLLVNPDFEDSKAFSPAGGSHVGNWFSWQSSSKATGDAQSGSGYAKFTAGDSALEQDLDGSAMIKGMTYVYSVWAKLSGTTDAEHIIGVKNYGGEELKQQVNSTEWKKYEIEFVYMDGNPRFYGYVGTHGGVDMYIDNASVTVKSAVESVKIKNGEMTVKFVDSYEGMPTADTLTATYAIVNGDSGKVTWTNAEWDPATKTAVLTFAKIPATPVEQEVKVNLTYEGATITLDFPVEANGEAIVTAALASVEAENGKLTVALDKAPTVKPAAEDFTFEYKIGDGEFKALETEEFAYDADAKEVTVSFAKMRGAEAQTVTVKVTYNEASKEDTFTTEVSEAATYYVDSTKGNDSNDGLSPETAFASIDKLNTITFLPGDEILFKKGETFVGCFKPQGSGTETAPITVGSYGEGDVRPVLQPGADWTVDYVMSANAMVTNVKVNYVLQFYNVEYWEVNDLEIFDPNSEEYLTRGSGKYIGNSVNDVYRSGITIQAEDIGVLEHFYIDNVIIHGFHGPGTNIGKTSGGITMNVITNKARNIALSVPTQINDIRITNCEIYDVGRSGINFLTPWSFRTEEKWGPFDYGTRGYNYLPYEDFYMANNYIYDVDGDGTIIDNCSNAVCEYNLVTRCCLRPATEGGGAAVGLFNWNSDNTYFQFNEVYDVRLGSGASASNDGQGIEIDALNDRTWVQYNYVHDNMGGFMMLCNVGDNYRSFDGIVRYNISQDDYTHPRQGLFDIYSANYGTEIYNNTFYLTERAVSKNGYGGHVGAGQLFLFSAVGSYETMKFYNNIFYYDGETPATANQFGDAAIDWQSNIFYGFTNLPENDNPSAPNFSIDPMLADPGKGGTGSWNNGTITKVDLSCYKLLENSPAINAGMPVANNGGRDYFGNEVKGIPDIGAYESGAVALKVASIDKAVKVSETENTVTVVDTDKVTVKALAEALVYDEGVTVEVKRGTANVGEEELLKAGDVVIAKLGEETLEFTVVVEEDPAGRDYPVEKSTAISESQYLPGTSNEGPDDFILDGNANTHWHTNWQTDEAANVAKRWVGISLEEATLIDGIRYLPRNSGGNGAVTEYQVQVRESDNGEWTTVATGNWDKADKNWKIVTFDAVMAKQVRVVGVHTYADSGNDAHMSTAEMRVMVAKATEPTPEVTPTETEAPQPTETEAPQPTETPEVKEDVTTVFDDVYKDWYTEYVQYVYDNSLMTGIKGTKHFAPNANITKAQVAQVLYNMEGQPAVENQKVFTELGDVYAAEWYAAAVAWAYNNNIVTGDLNTKKFNPNADVTREQLALMMFRYAGFKKYDVSVSSDLAGLKNAENVNNWAADGVKWAVGAGLISGVEKDGVKDLAPQGNASRAQVAAILQRFCENVAK